MTFGNSERYLRRLTIASFAFWDKTGNSETLVLTTHGLVKKQGKPRREKSNTQNRLEKNILKANRYGSFKNIHLRRSN